MGWILKTPACHVEDPNSVERTCVGCMRHMCLFHPVQVLSTLRPSGVQGMHVACRGCVGHIGDACPLHAVYVQGIGDMCIPSTLYCAITALDGYPSHSDNINYIWSATLIYVLPPSMDHAITSILDTPYICLLLPANICLHPVTIHSSC